MGAHRLLSVTVSLLLAMLVVLRAPAAAQASGDRAVQDKLSRIGTDLFSVTPHPADDIRELKEILAAAPSLPEAHLLLGIAYRAQGSPDLMAEAVAELRQALALKPDLVLARLTLARVYLDMARALRARDELDAALDGRAAQLLAVNDGLLQCRRIDDQAEHCHCHVSSRR